MLNIGGQRVPPKILLMVLGDGVFISVGLLVAAAVRAPYSGPLWVHFSTGGILARFALVVLASQLALYYNDLYNSPLVSRHSEIFVQLLQALGIACLVLGIFYYLSPEFSLGRGIAALAAPTILILTVGWRFWLNRSGFLHNGANRVLIVGTGSVGISLTREIISRPELNLKVVGFLDEKGENIGKSLVNPGIIGAVSDVETITANRSINRVVLSLAERRGCTPVRQLLHLKFAGIGVEDAHSLYEKITGRILLEHLSPSWLILSDGFRKSAFTVAAKRALDVFLSLVALVLTLPLMGLIAFTIWLDTGKPMLFCQKRAGLGGKLFHIFKFRSMYQDAEENGPSWAAEGDKRVTRVGRFLRKFRLDELPQLFNVLCGEMSLVGPRPEQPHFCALLEEHLSLFNLRHSVRPGITGWAQIKYKYGSSIEENKNKLEFDLFYIKHMSVLLDLAILFETAKVILYGRGAK
jgi:sugar transferase (PEP-CTERM system associated)